MPRRPWLEINTELPHQARLIVISFFCVMLLVGDAGLLRKSRNGGSITAGDSVKKVCAAGYRFR